jgi:hypothetical protein
LECILAHPSFKNTERCKNYLRYITEYSLHDEAIPLKERTVGIEVFGRTADYDTSHDSVVRNTASETRNRLAQYYEDKGSEDKIQFKTPPGSYRVEFYRLNETPVEDAPVELHVAPVKSVPWIPLSISLVAILLLIVAVVFGRWIYVLDMLRNNSNRNAGDLALKNLQIEPSRQPLELFWKPVLDSPSLVLLCLGGEMQPVLQTTQETSVGARNLSFSTASLIANISSLLGRSLRRFQMKPANSVTFDDFRDNSVVLIGGLDNLWTLRFTDTMRFRFIRAQAQEPDRIIDTAVKPAREWRLQPSHGPGSLQNYAIVARYRDPSTRKFVMVAAGLGDSGPELAGEFLTDPESIADLTKNLPKDWPAKNFEMVIATQVIDGKPGSPKVQAIEVW